MVENRNVTFGRDIVLTDENGEIVTDENGERIVRRYTAGALFPFVNGAKDFWLHQMIEGNPLQEKIALIMHNHFAVNHDALVVFGNREYAFMTQDYVNLLRQNSLGSFNNTLIKVTEDVSMIGFLNLDTNTDENTDENYGREFLELFTLKEVNEETGESNYTHDDIQSFSKAFTGLRIINENRPFELSYTDPESGETDLTTSNFPVRASLFDPTFWRADHINPTEYTYFEGESYEANAAFNYVQAAGYITQHPGVATHLGTTLHRTLINPLTSQEMVSSLARLARDKEYDVKEILRVILKSESMFSEESKNVCIKAPLETQVSFMRASGIPLKTKRREGLSLIHI